MLLLALVAMAHAAPVVLTGARLWDGTGGPVVEDAWIVVHGDRITAVGAGAPPEHEGALVRDLAGATVLPGLIDAHTHPWAVPGADIRDDPAEVRMAARRRGLRQFLACGVTTVLDTGVAWEDRATMKEWLADGEPGPRYLDLGPVLGPADGYVDAFLDGHAGLDTLPEIEAHLDRLVEEGSHGLKLTIEPGYFLPVLPMHEDQLRADIVAAATERELPVYVHAQRAEAQHLALDLGVHAVLHVPRDAPGDVPERLAEGGPWLVSTLNLDHAPLLTVDEVDLDDPLAQLVVPWDQRRTATSHRGWRAYVQRMAAVSLPHSSPALQRLAGLAMPTRDYLRAKQRQVRRTMAAMRAAGVSVAMGSDSGAYDAIPSYVHGLSSLRELELLVEASYSPEEALLAATRDAAAMLGREDLGVVVPGAAADLVIVEGDPLRDIADLRRITGVMAEGQLRSPKGWLVGPGR